MAQSDSPATEAVLAAIATGSSVNDAARLAGVSRRTASRIINDPRSQERLAGMREATMEHAARRMLGLVDLAANTLDAVMRDTEAGASARVSACRTVLTSAVTLTDAVEIERRLAEVEAAVGERTNWRRTA